MQNQIERTFDDMSYTDKEMAGLPVRYFLLDTNIKLFLENFVESLDKPDQSDNIEDVTMARELMVEASEILLVAIKRMCPDAK